MENKVDPQLLMNDQMKAVLQKSAELAGDAFVTDVGFVEMRENYVRERRFWNEGGPVMAKTIERTFEGPMGEFMARYYYPVEAEKLPVIEFIHGGGFVVGSPDTHDRVCRILAEKTGAVVVSVDYHLSPESKYPTNIQECVMVAKHLHEHGAEEGIDGDDLSFAGDSGGAVLSMASNLWLRDEEGDNSFVKSLLLYYGFYGLEDSMSQRLYGWDIDGMRKEDLIYYNECWLNDLATETKAPYVDMFHNDLTTRHARVLHRRCRVSTRCSDDIRAFAPRPRRPTACATSIEVFEGVHACICCTTPEMLDEADLSASNIPLSTSVRRPAIRRSFNRADAHPNPVIFAARPDAECIPIRRFLNGFQI